MASAAWVATRGVSASAASAGTNSAQAATQAHRDQPARHKSPAADTKSQVPITSAKGPWPDAKNSACPSVRPATRCSMPGTSGSSSEPTPKTAKKLVIPFSVRGMSAKAARRRAITRSLPRRSRGWHGA